MTEPLFRSNIHIHTTRDNPAGEYWLAYPESEAGIVEHLLGGKPWRADIEAAADFYRLARMHSLTLSSVPPEVEAFAGIPDGHR